MSAGQLLYWSRKRSVGDLLLFFVLFLPLSIFIFHSFPWWQTPLKFTRSNQFQCRLFYFKVRAMPERWNWNLCFLFKFWLNRVLTFMRLVHTYARSCTKSFMRTGIQLKGVNGQVLEPGKIPMCECFVDNYSFKQDLPCSLQGNNFVCSFTPVSMISVHF